MVGTTKTLGQWLADKPFTLALSSGFFGFYAHTGLVRALEESGIRPAGIAGSSAGALAGGLWSGGVDSAELWRVLSTLSRHDFWDPSPGLGLLRGARFRELLHSHLRVNTFSQCRFALAISAFDLRTRRTTVIRQGDLAAAIHASCAFPLLFQPVRREGRLLSDGGIADRPGLAGVGADARVLYHHLASRSPWRRRGSAALSIPSRNQMVTISIPNLPRAHPFRLEPGIAAMQHCYHATLNALRAPVSHA